MPSMASFRPIFTQKPSEYRTPSPPPRDAIEPLSVTVDDFDPPQKRRNNATNASAYYNTQSNGHIVENRLGSDGAHNSEYDYNAQPMARSSSAMDAFATIALATSPKYNTGQFDSHNFEFQNSHQWNHSISSSTSQNGARLSPYHDEADERPFKRARSEVPVVKSLSTAPGVRPATSYVGSGTWSPNSVGGHYATSGTANDFGSRRVTDDAELLLNLSRPKVTKFAPVMEESTSQDQRAVAGLGLLLNGSQSNNGLHTARSTLISGSNSVKQSEPRESAADAHLSSHNGVAQTQIPASSDQILDTTTSNAEPPADGPIAVKTARKGRGSRKGTQTRKPVKGRGRQTNREQSSKRSNIKTEAQHVLDGLFPSADVPAGPRALPSRTQLEEIQNTHNLAVYSSKPTNLNILTHPNGLALTASLKPPDLIDREQLTQIAASSLSTIPSSSDRSIRAQSAPVLSDDAELNNPKEWSEFSSATPPPPRPLSASGYGRPQPAKAEMNSTSEPLDEKVDNKNARCAACALLQSSLGGDEGSDMLSWIGCDHCKRWFHAACAKLSEKDIKLVDKFSCKDCSKVYGATTFVRKSNRTHASIDYAGLNEGLVKTSAEDPEHPYVKPLRERSIKFLPDDLQRCRPEEVTLECLEKPGVFVRPLLIPAAFHPRPSDAPSAITALEAASALRAHQTSEHLSIPAAKIHKWLNAPITQIDVPDTGADAIDMVIPKDLTVRRSAELYGLNETVEVIDVKNQEGESGRPCTLKRWADYYESEQRRVIRNVISLEISFSELGKLVKRPEVVRKMDLADAVWPPELKAKADFPKVQLYCLMSVANSYTDFHIDFGGSSVFYHIIRGKKTFLFIPPRPKHLKKYEQWCLSPAQNQTFLPDQTKDCMRVDLSEGDTMLIPSGWIHAVWTPEDSLVIGGNFLTRLHLGMQIQITAVEKTTKVPLKFRYPKFQKVMWFAAIKYIESDPVPENIVKMLESGAQFSRSNDTETVTEENPSVERNSTQAEEKKYPQGELDGLHDLCRFLLRTALIAEGKITDGISQDARSRVRGSIPKGHGEPMEIMKKLAIWIAWRRGNEHIPEWAYPDHEFPDPAAGTGAKLNTALLKKLDRDATQAAQRRTRQTRASKSEPQPLKTLTTTNEKVIAPEVAVSEGISEKVALQQPLQETANTVEPKVEETELPKLPAVQRARKRSPQTTKSKEGKVPACQDCRTRKRRCIHDANGEIDQEKYLAATEKRKAYTKRARKDDQTTPSKRIKETPADEASQSEHLTHLMNVDAPNYNPQLHGTSGRLLQVDNVSTTIPTLSNLSTFKPEDGSDAQPASSSNGFSYRVADTSNNDASPITARSLVEPSNTDDQSTHGTDGSSHVTAKTRGSPSEDEVVLVAVSKDDAISEDIAAHIPDHPSIPSPPMVHLVTPQPAKITEPAFSKASGYKKASKAVNARPAESSPLSPPDTISSSARSTASPLADSMTPTTNGSEFVVVNTNNTNSNVPGGGSRRSSRAPKQTQFLIQETDQQSPLPPPLASAPQPIVHRIVSVNVPSSSSSSRSAVAHSPNSSARTPTVVINPRRSPLKPVAGAAATKPAPQGSVISPTTTNPRDRLRGKSHDPTSGEVAQTSFPLSKKRRRKSASASADSTTIKSGEPQQPLHTDDEVKKEEREWSPASKRRRSTGPPARPSQGTDRSTSRGAAKRNGSVGGGLETSPPVVGENDEDASLRLARELAASEFALRRR